MGDDGRVALAAGPFHIGRLHGGDVLAAACHHHLHAIDQHLLGCAGNRHQAGGALPVYRLARHAHRQACGQQGIACQVHAGGAPGQHAADDHIVHLRRVHPGARHRVLDGVAHQMGRAGVVERAPVGPADARAGGGNNDGVFHGGAPGW